MIHLEANLPPGLSEIWMDAELPIARAQLFLKTGKVDSYEKDHAKEKEF